MIVNAKKHKALIISQTDHKFSFPVKCELHIFGMTIDNRLNFGSHISTVCYGSAISSLRTQCSSCTRHSFCHTFIIVLQCGIFVEHATVKSYKRILRFILNDYTSHSETPLCLTKVEMTSLYNKRIQNFLILFKSLFF